MSNVVTISASYGAHGDKIAHAVAEQLDLPFFDRAIPAAVAHQLAQSDDIEESLDAPVPRRWQRVIMGFANVPSPTGPSQPPEVIETPERFRLSNETTLREVADSTGGVILGRAAMVVLGDRPDVLCVRLDGPVEARIAQVIAQGVDEESARKGQRAVDRARDAYAHVFFGARQNDPSLYHLALDSTAISVAGCVDIIIRAARDRFQPLME